MKRDQTYIWPSEKEDKITRKFYRELSRLTKKATLNNTKRLNFFELLLSIIKFKKNLKPNL